MSAESEALLRFSIFVGVFAAVAAAEAAWPRRVRDYGRVQRWFTNVGLCALNTMLLRLSFFAVPALTVLAAAYVEQAGWGLLPALQVPFWAAVIVGFLVLDLAVYAQHVAVHYIPFLWRLHRVHHADPDFDVSTGIRFHPFEILLSQAWKIAVVLAVGAPAAAVLAFEIVLNATSMFSHGNLRLPRAADRALRFAVVTPEMHRVHHSTIEQETNSNFGFNLSLWDRLFGTYRAEAMGDPATMAIGLPSYRDASPTRIVWSLSFPFARGAAA